VSPVFRHGRLRLYLLKLLDEAPRHGYEVIRLLQDRFLGVYAPSPGTIYPRLARLEEEGLVTHDEVEGKKVYRITEKGREEIRGRLDDLADLEEEITESVRDIAREVTEDVRDTVRNLREELTWATRDVRRQSREQARDEARERARRAREEVRESARRAREESRPGPGQSWPEQPEPEQPEPEKPGPDQAGAEQAGAEQAGAEQAVAQQPGRLGPGSGGRIEWPDLAALRDWQAWASWGPLGGRQRPGGPGGWAGGSRPGRGGSAWQNAVLFRDLERLAINFARELRSAAWHTEWLPEDAISDLREILEDTLTRIRDEVFGGSARAGKPDQPKRAGQPGEPDEPDEPEEPEEPGDSARP
jgi:DNA-binding PadR family transcriptional regulator